MALKDMALTAEEAKEQDCCAPLGGGEADGPKYPWGLRIDLDDGSMQKLGIGLMPVGTEVMVLAKARVTSTSSYEREGSDNESSMGLQIVAIDLNTAQSDPMQRAAGKLYPSS